MENIAVSYCKNWDCEGYSTTQNITLTTDLLHRFNDFLTDCRKFIEKKRCINNSEMNLLMYAKNIENLNKCLTITQLHLLHQFLSQNHIDCSRIKTDRNTMIKIARK